MTDIVVDSTSPETLRAQLVERLRTHGWITDPRVAAAFARVPRHLFAPPGTSLSAAYADDTVPTKRGPDGKTLSSISAPWLQAYMIQAAQVAPGSRALEIGSGVLQRCPARRGRRAGRDGGQRRHRRASRR